MLVVDLAADRASSSVPSVTAQMQKISLWGLEVSLVRSVPNLCDKSLLILLFISWYPFVWRDIVHASKGAWLRLESCSFG
jgi:hypothetical protein